MDKGEGFWGSYLSSAINSLFAYASDSTTLSLI